MLQTSHADGKNNTLWAVQRQKSLPEQSSGSPAGDRFSDDSHTSYHSIPHHHRYVYGNVAPGSGLSERYYEESPAPSLMRVSVDLLTGGKSITAVMDPLSTVLDLKQRIKVRASTLPQSCNLCTRFPPRARDRCMWRPTLATMARAQSNLKSISPWESRQQLRCSSCTTLSHGTELVPACTGIPHALEPLCSQCCHSLQQMYARSYTIYTFSPKCLYQHFSWVIAVL
jgi:hypothetical protein